MGLERREERERRCHFFWFQVEDTLQDRSVCACLGAIGGGRGLGGLFERWNINATLSLIFLHLSPTCPLRAPLSLSMNRHSLDINRQLVGSLFFKGKHTRTPLALFFLPSAPFSPLVFFHSEKKLIFNSLSRQSHSEAFHPLQFNAQTETSGTFISSASGSTTCLSPPAAGHSPLLFFFFSFCSIQCYF